MKRLVIALGVVAFFVLGAPATSNAGGWVVVSLDAAPVMRAGETVDVGFTVLRHGVTPETSDDLDVVLSDSSGTGHRFRAAPEGAVGHHVATITVPAAGSYTWEVTGEFVGADLGRLDVGESTSGTTWTWGAMQWGSLTLAAAMAGLAGRDVLRSRRRPVAPPVAA